MAAFVPHRSNKYFHRKTPMRFGPYSTPTGRGGQLRFGTKLQVPDSIGKSWDALKTEFKNAFEVAAEAAAGDGGGKPALAQAP